MEVTHLQYDEDTLIFCDAEESWLKYLRIILILFKAILGLYINGRKQKNRIFPINEVAKIQ